MAAAGTVSGGSLVMTVNLDVRFCSLIPFVTVQITQGTAADAGCRVQVRGLSIPTVVDQTVVPAVIDDVSAFQVAKTVNLAPVIIPGGGEDGSIQASFDNVDGDLYFLDTLIYLFNIRVRELTPMGPLLWARGAT